MRKVRAPRFFPDGRLKLPPSNLQIPSGGSLAEALVRLGWANLTEPYPSPTSNQNLNLRNGSLVMARFLSSRRRGWLTAPGHSTTCLLSLRCVRAGKFPSSNPRVIGSDAALIPRIKRGHRGNLSRRNRASVGVNTEISKQLTVRLVFAGVIGLSGRLIVVAAALVLLGEETRSGFAIIPCSFCMHDGWTQTVSDVSATGLETRC